MVWEKDPARDTLRPPTACILARQPPPTILVYLRRARRRTHKGKLWQHVQRSGARGWNLEKSAHGVRKIAATTAAYNGATVHQLMSIFGWKTTQMAELYNKEANRKRLAR